MSTLFVVDSDDVFQFLVKMLFARHPVFTEVQHFNCAVPVLAYLSENKDNNARLPDVIFMELRFHLVDGWDILNDLQTLYHSLCKKVAIYIVTASAASADRARVANYNCVREFISKPLRHGKVIAIGNEFRR